MRAICDSLQSTRPQCPEISDQYLAYYLMYKTDSFVHNGPTTKKAQHVQLGCRSHPSILTSHESVKVCVLNADVHLDEDGEPVSCLILQAEIQTGQHLIADPKSIAKYKVFSVYPHSNARKLLRPQFRCLTVRPWRVCSGSAL